MTLPILRQIWKKVLDNNITTRERRIIYQLVDGGWKGS